MAGVQPSVTANGIFAGALPAMPDLNIPFQDYESPFPKPSPETQIRYPFLKDVQWEEQIGSGAENWTYDSRRGAQPILPFLYLGPRTAIKNPIRLQEQGISMLVALHRTDFEASLLDKPLCDANSVGLSVISTRVPSYQSIPAVCRSMVTQMVTFLQRQKAETGKSAKILVCCETGNEVSAALVCAFLVDVLGCDLGMATRIVNARRFSVSMNDHVKHALLAYEDISKAQRAAQGPVDSLHGSVAGLRKTDMKRKLITEDGSADSSAGSDSCVEQQWRNYPGPFSAPADDMKASFQSLHQPPKH